MNAVLLSNRTCPTVEGQDLALRYILIRALTFSLNPTSSIYPPLRPHLKEIMYSMALKNRN